MNYKDHEAYWHGVLKYALPKMGFQHIEHEGWINMKSAQRVDFLAERDRDTYCIEVKTEQSFLNDPSGAIGQAKYYSLQLPGSKAILAVGCESGRLSSSCMCLGSTYYAIAREPSLILWVILSSVKHKEEFSICEVDVCKRCGGIIYDDWVYTTGIALRLSRHICLFADVRVRERPLVPVESDGPQVVLGYSAECRDMILHSLSPAETGPESDCEGKAISGGAEPRADSDDAPGGDRGDLGGEADDTR